MGTSSLCYAAQGGFLPIVKLLLKYGADIDACGLVSTDYFLSFLKLSFLIFYN